MDIQMPKMDGLEACKQIKALDSEQVVIALTANVFTEQKETVQTAYLMATFLSLLKNMNLIKALRMNRNA